ncbi:sensor domain-containing diguanylate cyclase, partial [Sulfurimonas sp. SAG-AH-194-C21]
SIYCANILYKGEFRGVLYIEHQNIRDIFTKNRIEILQLLLSQAATAIENAQLFQEIANLNITLENRVKKRTLELENVITDLEHSKEELKLLAATDPMTKLYNRRYFSKVSTNIFNIAKRDKYELSLIMLDIDFFKKVNDSYGHAVGDEVIISFAKLLFKHSRQSDILCRFGGEEFLILLPSTDSNGAMKIAQKIREETEKLSLSLKTNENKKIELKYTVSVGVYTLDTQSDKDIESGILKVDTALYRAKESGRNKVSLFS